MRRANTLPCTSSVVPKGYEANEARHNEEGFSRRWGISGSSNAQAVYYPPLLAPPSSMGIHNLRSSRTRQGQQQAHHFPGSQTAREATRHCRGRLTTHNIPLMMPPVTERRRREVPFHRYHVEGRFSTLVTPRPSTVGTLVGARALSPTSSYNPASEAKHLGVNRQV